MSISSNPSNPSLNNSHRPSYSGLPDSASSPKFAPIAQNQTEAVYDMLRISEGHRTSAHLAEAESQRLHGELDSLRNQHLNRYARRATVSPAFRLFHLWYITKGMQPHLSPGADKPNMYFHTAVVGAHTFIELRRSVKGDPQYASVGVLDLIEIAFEFGKFFPDDMTRLAVKVDEQEGFGEHGRAAQLQSQLDNIQKTLLDEMAKEASENLARAEDKKVQDELNIEFKDGKWQEKKAQANPPTQQPAMPPGEQPRAKRKYVRKNPLVAKPGIKPAAQPKK